MATTSTTSNLVIRVPVDEPEGVVECGTCGETEDLRVAEVHNAYWDGDLHWVCKCCYEDDQEDACHYHLIGDDWSDDEEDEDEDEEAK
jgi:hypothetical protein